jgi:hypothetical protein
LNGIQEVVGSIPIGSTTSLKTFHPSAVGAAKAGAAHFDIVEIGADCGPRQIGPDRQNNQRGPWCVDEADIGQDEGAWWNGVMK